MSYSIPYVIEKDKRRENAHTIFIQDYCRERIIFLSNEVNDDIAKPCSFTASFLESQDSTKDIHLYINSPGGSVEVPDLQFTTQ